MGSPDLVRERMRELPPAKQAQVLAFVERVSVSDDPVDEPDPAADGSRAVAAQAPLPSGSLLGMFDDEDLDLEAIDQAISEQRREWRQTFPRPAP